MNRRDCKVELCICFGALSKQYRFREAEKAQLKTFIQGCGQLQDLEYLHCERHPHGGRTKGDPQLL